MEAIDRIEEKLFSVFPSFETRSETIHIFAVQGDLMKMQRMTILSPSLVFSKHGTTRLNSMHFAALKGHAEVVKVAA